MSQLDDKTFGDSKAAIILAQILSESDNKNHIRFVSKHWNKYTEIFNEIWYSKLSINHKTYLTDLLTERELETIKSSGLSDKEKSYFSNIICARKSIWNKVATNVTRENLRLIRDRKSASKNSENTP